MKLRFWGVRGSIATPLASAAIEDKLIQALLGAADVDLRDEAAVRAYVGDLPLPARGTWGGNTSCFEVRSAAGDLLIVDAGTGLRELGRALLQTEYGRGRGRAALAFTHTHWDHIQGFPFFGPLYVAGNRFDLYARHEALEDRIRHQQTERFFPVTLDQMAASMQFHRLDGPIDLFDGRVRLCSLDTDHPGGCTAYRIEADGRVVVIATDTEYRELVGPNWQRYVDFYRDADVLVFDAQYSLGEAMVDKQNWGHSSALIGVDLALEAGVRKLVFVHYEPAHSDARVAEIGDGAVAYLERQPRTKLLETIVAYEGLEIEL